MVKMLIRPAAIDTRPAAAGHPRDGLWGGHVIGLDAFAPRACLADGVARAFRISFPVLALKFGRPLLLFVRQFVLVLVRLGAFRIGKHPGPRPGVIALLAVWIQAVPTGFIARKVGGGEGCVATRTVFHVASITLRKYNAAALADYRVLRFTRAMLADGTALAMIQLALELVAAA